MTERGQDSLDAYRPNEAQLDSEWPSERRNALRDRITAQSRSDGRSYRRRLRQHRPHRLRWALAAVAIAGVAALLGAELTLPPGEPGGPNEAAAAALQQLASVAIAVGGPTVESDQFGYSEVSYLSTDGSTLEKYWQSPGGGLWRQVVTSTGEAHPVGCYYYAPPKVNPQFPDFGFAAPALLNQMPTDPSALHRYLDNHVQVSPGGQPLNQLIFGSVVDLVTNPASPPALRAAAIRVLALDTRRVTVMNGAHDTLGRPATVLTFKFDHLSGNGADATFENAPGQSEVLYFNPSTAQLLQLDYAQYGKVGSTELIRAETVVSQVPASLLACIAAKPPAPPPH